MAFETKEQVLEKILSKPKSKCKYCQQEMNLWEPPSITFGDGLGWGSAYLYVCYNDECSVYQSGWDNLRENYAHNASYRCICYPESGKFELMPVFSSQGGTGQIVDEEAMAAEEVLKENIKKGFSVLTECYNRRDMVPVLHILLDPAEPVRVRVKAVEMIGDFGEIEALEPIRNLKFGNDILQKAADSAVKKIHERYFTRECPFCAEIIKKRAKICKHCGQEVAGK